MLPKDLAALLEDVRYPKPLRHLRRLYPDPITGTPEWGVVRDGDGIAGVYSLSDASPIKQAGFVPAYENFNGRSSYRDWVFAFTVPRRAPLLPAPAPGTVLPVSPPSKSLPVRGKPP